MRIAIVSDVYFPRVNGVSTSIETFHRELVKAGVAVSLLCPAYGADVPLPDVLRVPSRPVPRDPEDRLMSYRAARRFDTRLGQEGVSLVHVQTPFVAHYAGMHLARSLGVPLVTTYHTLFEEYLHHYLPMVPRRVLQGLARHISRTQCNAADHVVVPSAAMRERLAAYGVTTPMTVLPTGVPTEQFARGEGGRFRAIHDIAPERPVALFVGRVAFEKNIGFLLQMVGHARKRCPDVLLVITGEGPARSELQAQARREGLADAVRFVDYLDRRQDLPDCYAAASAFVFASRTETQGLVLLEAMAAGTPVVALAAMGTTDILAPERGAVIAPDDVAGFAQCLTDLLRDPVRRETLSHEARAYAATWSDRAMALRMQSLYQALTGSSEYAHA